MRKLAGIALPFVGFVFVAVLLSALPFALCAWSDATFAAHQRADRAAVRADSVRAAHAQTRAHIDSVFFAACAALDSAPAAHGKFTCN